MSIFKTIEIHLNPTNPRTITKKEYRKLVERIRKAPHYMKLQPLILNEDKMILDGNMRYRACKELGWVEIPAQVFTKAAHIASDAWTKYKRTYEECCTEIIFTSNLHSGEFDFDIVTNIYNDVDVEGYGLNVWNPDKEIEEKQRCELCDQILR